MYRGNPHQGIAGFEPPGRRMPTMPHEVTHQAPGRISNDRMSGWINNFITGGDTGAHESMHGPLAELTQEQMDFMGSPYNTPDFGVSKKDLYDKVKDMENKRWDLEWGVQEPTTPQEFNDYYNQLQQGTTGNWLAMNKGLDNWGRGNKTYDGTFRVPGFGDPNALDPWGQDWDYRDDDYDINVLDPGFNDYGPGPLYFG